MRVLVLDEAVEARVQKVKEFASLRRQSIHQITERMTRPEEAPGDDPNYMLEMMDGFKVVYTIEQHPGGWFQHISVSVDPRDQEKPWPPVAAVNMILKLFGLGTVTSAYHVWKEEGPRKAINFLFPFSESG